MKEMRKLLDLMESATEEVSEGFFSSKVSQEEFYKQLNYMLDKIIAQQETILTLNESLERTQEFAKKLGDAIVSIQERILDDGSAPPDENTPPDNKIH